MIVNKKTLASILGVSTNTVGKWMERGCPHDKDGNLVEFESAIVIEWLYGEKPTLSAHRGNDFEGDEEREKIDPEYEKGRKDKEQADKVALENRVRRGELVEFSEVSSLWADVALAVRSKVMGLGSKLAPLLVNHSDPRAIEKKVNAEARQVCLELSKHDENDGSDSEA